jgi:UDP-N-acetylglucosamine 1-carboxyvinyltransferase
VLLGLHADGISRIFDYRYPERIKYCEELAKLYPNQLEWKKGEIVTMGKNKMTASPAKVTSTDLRGSMALVLGALLADGTSEISNVEMALRGYNRLEEKLALLGISIEILTSN